MNAGDIVNQIRGMSGLMSEANRVIVAKRFCELITKTIEKGNPAAVGHWLKVDAPAFMAACQLNPGPGHSSIEAFIEKWEAVDTWRLFEDDEWVMMSQESFNVKATILRDLREVLDAPRSE